MSFPENFLWGDTLQPINMKVGWQVRGRGELFLSFMTLKLKVEFEDGVDLGGRRIIKKKNCKIVEDDCEIFL